MGLLENIISCMTNEEKSEFSLYLVKNKENPKENLLFDALCMDNIKKQEQKIALLYDEPNPKALSLLRLRLTEKTTEFISLSCMNKVSIYIINEPPLILVADWLMERNAIETAKKHLLRAEKSALQNHQYQLLDSIYNFQLLHADEFEIEINELKAKWTKNMELHDNMRKLNALYAEIRVELAEHKKNGTIMDVVQWVNDIFSKFNFTKSALKNATFMLRLAEICRSAIVSTKEYAAFEPYLLRVFESLKKHNAFEGAQSEHEVSFVMIIAHTLYRQRKFAEAHQWLEHFEKLVPQRKLKSHKLFPKYIGLQISILCYTGKNKEAIALNTQTLEDSSIKLPLKYRLDLQLNLAVYYFNEMNFKMANLVMKSLPPNDKFIEDTKGLEWRFKKEMIHVIIHYELGNLDLTQSKIRAMIRYYRKFFDHGSYQIAAIYLKQISKLVNDPDKVRTPEFSEEVRLIAASWPAERLDIQAITFLCWLKSKIKQRDYYEVLLEWMNKKIETIKKN
jgi:hypothetical protein